MRGVLDVTCCVVCDCVGDVKPARTAAFYGADYLQDKPVCGRCFSAAIAGRKQEVTYLNAEERRERDERRKLR